MTTTLLVQALAMNAEHTFSKHPVQSLQLIAGEGVRGDAHCGRTTQHLYRKRRTPLLPNLCQVHLLAAERLDEWAAAGFAVAAGQFGENVLTSGLDLHGLPLGTKLRTANGLELQVTGERTPCSQIDAFRPGLQARCWGEAPPGTPSRRLRRAGIMAQVVAGGVLHVGDALHIALPPQPHQPLPAV